ncbi:UNVERIFIED_CONTAM: hypothetical protein NCL1_52671 [Trichonephila clavipes]
MLYDVAWKTDFECLLVEGNSILFVCAAKSRLLILQDMDHEQDADQPNPTRAQYVTNTANKQVKEEVACIGMNKSLEQSLQEREPMTTRTRRTYVIVKVYNSVIS